MNEKQKNVPIILFVYNRAEHTKMVLKYLDKNIGIADTALYIFSDGAKTGEEQNVANVRAMLQEFLKNNHFGMVEIKESPMNKGLAKSVISGVSSVLQEYDSVIVEKFLNELANDLNVANGFTILYDLVKKLNVSIRSNSLEDTSKYYLTLLELNKVLSFDLGVKELSKEDIDLYNKWNEYKKEKDFVKADECRNELINRGVL